MCNKGVLSNLKLTLDNSIQLHLQKLRKNVITCIKFSRRFTILKLHVLVHVLNKHTFNIFTVCSTTWEAFHNTF